jgi:hypothetical protein
LPLHRFEQLADLLVGAVPFDSGSGVDNHLLRVGRNRMCDFEVHHRLGTGRAWLTPDQHRREPRQSRRVGERVEVLLVVSAEFEEHDRCALAGKARGSQRVGVVRLQQRLRTQSPARHVQRQKSRARLMVGGVTQDPAQRGDDVANGLGNRRLPRRRVEHLPLATVVIVHRHVERRRHVLRGTFDDGPGVAGSPPHRHAMRACPFDQRLRASRVMQRDRELHTTVAGWTEIR